MRDQCIRIDSIKRKFNHGHAVGSKNNARASKPGPREHSESLSYYLIRTSTTCLREIRVWGDGGRRKRQTEKTIRAKVKFVSLNYIHHYVFYCTE